MDEENDSVELKTGWYPSLLLLLTLLSISLHQLGVGGSINLGQRNESKPTPKKKKQK